MFYWCVNLGPFHIVFHSMKWCLVGANIGMWWIEFGLWPMAITMSYEQE